MELSGLNRKGYRSLEISYPFSNTVSTFFISQPRKKKLLKSMEFRKATKGCEILLPSGSYDPKNLRKFVKDGKFILYAIYDANYEFPDRFKSDTPLDHCISNKALILGWYTSLVTAKRLTTFWNNRLKDVIILALEYYVVSNYSDLTVEIREKNPSI